MMLPSVSSSSSPPAMATPTEKYYYNRLNLKWLILFVFASYAAFVYLFVLYPSPERILFVQTVTGTRFSHISAFAAEDPRLFDNLSPVVRSVLSVQDLDDLKVACMKIQTSRVEGALHYHQHVGGLVGNNDSSALLSAAGQQEQQDGPTSPTSAARTSSSSSSSSTTSRDGKKRLTGPFSAKRYNAKLHLICPFYLIFDYPLCYTVAKEWGLAYLPFISANLISVIHPICGLIAGLLFARAVKERSGAETPPGVEPCGDGPSTSTWGEASAVTSSSSSNSTNAQCTKISRTLSSTAFLTSVDMPLSQQGGGGGVGGGASMPSSGGGSSASGGVVTSSNTQLLESSLGDPAATAVVVGSPICVFDSDEAWKEKEGHVALCATSVDVRLVRLGCFFFFVRNWLDALDGVVARVQRAESGDFSPIAATTGFGMNGHSLDVAADGLGAFLACLGILLFLFRRQVLLSRLLFSLVTTRFGVSFRWMTARGISVGRAVAFAGLLLPAAVGGLWEMYMLRYSNLFDVHSHQREDIFHLEQQLQIKINMALWSVTCADTLFYVYLVAMFFDGIWPVLQFYAGVGYLWLALITAHSHYVWGVIGNHPGARQLLAQMD